MAGPTGREPPHAPGGRSARSPRRPTRNRGGCRLPGDVSAAGAASD
jgi:hypothetical protein